MRSGPLAGNALVSPALFVGAQQGQVSGAKKEYSLRHPELFWEYPRFHPEQNWEYPRWFSANFAERTGKKPENMGLTGVLAVFQPWVRRDGRTRQRIGCQSGCFLGHGPEREQGHRQRPPEGLLHQLRASRSLLRVTHARA
jgi:hypothetical protein